MKTTDFIPELLTNPVSRNLILILLGTLFVAVATVTAAFLMIG